MKYPVKLGEIHPLEDALLEHWIRVDVDPQKHEKNNP
jgi:hypothetical protein